MPTLAIPLTLSPIGATADIVGGNSIGLSDQTGVVEIPSFTAIAGTGTLTITPNLNGCVGTPQTVVITVNNCNCLTSFIIEKFEPSCIVTPSTVVFSILYEWYTNASFPAVFVQSYSTLSEAQAMYPTYLLFSGGNVTDAKGTTFTVGQYIYETGGHIPRGDCDVIANGWYIGERLGFNYYIRIGEGKIREIIAS